MPPIRQDLSKANQFTVYQVGDYPAFVYKIEETVSNGDKNKGCPMLKVQYKLQDRGGSVFDNILLNEQFAWKWKQLCLAAGIDEDRLGEDSEVDTVEVQGELVMLSLGIQPAQGQYDEKNVVRKVQNYNSYTPSTPAAQGVGFFG